MKNADEGYRGRLVDGRIESLLGSFGGVLITGPKWCGKSWTGFHHARSALLVDQKPNLAKARLAPYEALSGEYPLLVDEWQHAPELWDAARRRIDFERARGMYIFTGSATPPGDAPMHSGTGRFATVEMRTLSSFESGDSDGSASLSALFDRGRVEVSLSDMGFPKATEIICRGGWPDAVWSANGNGAETARGYLSSVAESDISRADGVRRSATTSRAVLRSLARNSATQVKYTTIRSDASRDDGTDVSDQTVGSYVEALKKIFVVCEQEAWLPSLRSRTRMRTSPKIHLTDPSLAAAAMKATPKLLLDDPGTAGLLFESLCYRDLCVYAQNMGGEVLFFRDEKGFEIDEIVVLDDGRWGAIEVKLGDFEFDAAARNLLRLKDRMSDGARGPSFLAILSASGGAAHTRDDGVAVIPIDKFGP
jgi:predicted AAA+ superfamily ATPase